ncbi:hypothetical protein [Plantactinospora sp. BC1]|uniref:hypothetical protein n=1 Tax=Plantactinospora sp. BC1 TaxID=2108470 RepID=UPI00131EE4B9|nr:hypothetical protein [Plantactinospora sp. BC1]
MSPQVPGAEPGDVVGHAGGGIVVGLESGVLAQAGDVEPGRSAVSGREEFEPETGLDGPDRGDDLVVAGGTTGGDVVRRVVQFAGELQEREGAAGVPDVEKVEGVLRP